MYLPFVLLVYYVVPRKFRNLFLFIVNLIFYGWGEPVFVLLMLISTFVGYIHGYFIEKYRSNQKLAKGLIVSCAVITLGLLAFFKYAGFLSNTLNILPFVNLPVLTIPLPIGISFYTFQILSYAIDVYRKDAPVQKNFISFGTYVALFPQLIAGPIVRYKDVAYQLDHRRETLVQFTTGVKLFMVGLAKKVLIANQMGAMWDAMRQTGEANGILGSWIGIGAYAFQIYFDFSGYSDMACGLGNMFGFEFLKNFNYPYIAKSITEFWRRWHISLSTWFKEYVYIPLGGNRKGPSRQIFNLLVVWFLTGFWHGAAFNFILWGLYYGVILIIEKFLLNRFLEKMPAVLRHIYSLFIILIGWTIFYFEDMGAMGSYLVSMFTFADGIIGGQALSITLSYLPLLIAAALASTPLGTKLYLKFREQNWMWLPETAFCVLVLFISTSSLVNQSYNPFLYFRF